MVPYIRAMLQVISALIGKFREKIMPNVVGVQKCPKNSQKKVIIHVFGLLGDRGLDAMGCLLGTWEVIRKKFYGFERIYECFHVHFGEILGCTRN